MKIDNLRTNGDRLREAVREFEPVATELSEALRPFGVEDLSLSDKILEAREIVRNLDAANKPWKNES